MKFISIKQSYRKGGKKIRKIANISTNKKAFCNQPLKKRF